MEFEPVIGLEIHIQLNTNRKMFCNCNNNTWEKDPNSVTCPVCLGLPGALPVPNKKAIEYCQLLGVALNCSLNTNSHFDRKHYFYPDLAKGYQISQYKFPFCINGFVDTQNGKVEIERIHLEEDTAKSMHDNALNASLIDYNKAGKPLVELVTKPQIHSAQQAHEFAKYIAYIAQFLEISNVNMERGNLRIEPSISIRNVGETNLPPYKVELKNINSFKFMKDAINAEIERQKKEIQNGNIIPQQTRGYAEKTKTTFLQRVKEEEHEYRYFIEPDIPPFEFDENYMQTLKSKLPKLPNEIVAEFTTSHSVDSSKARELLLTGKLELVKKLIEKGVDAKKAVNTLLSSSEEKMKEIENNLDDFIKTLTSQKTDLMSDADLLEIVKKVINENEKVVEDYKNGKTSVLNYLVGCVMRDAKGKADASLAQKILLANIQ